MINWNKYHKENISNVSLLLKRFIEVPENLDASVRPKALDLGCGNGTDTNYLASLGFNVTCVDRKINPKKFKKLNIHFICKDMREFNFEPDKYDLIIARNSLQFIDEPYEIIEKMKQSTYKGGKIIIQTFSKHVFNKVESLYYFDIDELKETFKDWDILNCREYEVIENHDNFGYHSHIMIDLVALKRVL